MDPGGCDRDAVRVLGCSPTEPIPMSLPSHHRLSTPTGKVLFTGADITAGQEMDPKFRSRKELNQIGSAIRSFKPSTGYRWRGPRQQLERGAEVTSKLEDAYLCLAGV
jgi:hypothetical protein